MNSRKAFLIIGIILFFVHGSSLVIIFLTPDNIWWTPESMKLSLDEASDSFVSYIDDEKLDNRLEKGEIFLKRDDKMHKVERNDFSFRVNNWHKMKASKLGMVAVNSALSFGGLLFIIYGSVPFFYVLKHRSR